MATKKKELLEQEAPVTETVMSEGETLPADTAQPESLPADTGNSLDLNELLGLMDQPQQDTSGEDMNEDPLPELTEEEMFGDTPAETDDQSAAPTDMPEDFDVQPGWYFRTRLISCLVPRRPCLKRSLLAFRTSEFRQMR